MALKLLLIIIDLKGGSGAYCRLLASALRNSFPDEFHVSLLTLRPGSILPEDNQNFDRIIEFSSPARLLGIKTLRRTIRAIKDVDPNRIMCVGTFANLLVPLLVPRRNSILTVHSNYTRLLGESRKAWILRPMLRWRLARSQVVAPSRGVADDLTTNFAARHMRVIHHGIDAGKIGHLAEQTPADLPTSPYIIAVGRLSREKDYPTLLSAYDAARKRGLALPLVIVGDGPDRLNLQHQIDRLGLTGKVQLIGHRENPYPYMKNAQFLALSSLWEGFGLVILEAMSLGVPCVTTDCPSGPGEILAGGEFGLLCPPANSDQLASAMLRMAEPQTRAHFAQAARRRSNDFTLDQMAVAYKALLNSDTLRS